MSVYEVTILSWIDADNEEDVKERVFDKYGASAHVIAVELVLE